MTPKQTIIKAIKEMDISLLEVVLEDGKSYMDVPKETFIAKLSEVFELLKKAGIKSFCKTVKGTCETCNKGCGGISFVTSDYQYMDVLFEGTEENVTDIYTCTNFKNAEVVVKKHEIHFTFRKEENVEYRESHTISKHRQKAEKVTSDFKQFKNTISGLETIACWHQKHKKVQENLYSTACEDYEFIEDFIHWFKDFACLLEIVENNREYMERLEELEEAEGGGEEEIIICLLKYDSIYAHSYSFNFNKIHSKSKNRFLEWKQDKSVIIDCLGFEEAIMYYVKYGALMNAMMEKYKPLEEHHEEEKYIIQKLYTYLEKRGVYLNLVNSYKVHHSIDSPKPKREKTKKEKFWEDFDKNVNNCTPLMDFAESLRDKVLIMDVLNNWLGEYELDYDKISTTKRLNLNPKLRKYGIKAPSPGDVLVHHYEIFEEIHEHYKKEEYFKTELEKYNTLIAQNRETDAWFKKNKDYYKIPHTYSYFEDRDNEDSLVIMIKGLMFEDPNLVLDKNEFTNALKMGDILRGMGE